MLKYKVICGMIIMILATSMMGAGVAASREDEISMMALILSGVPQEKAKEMVNSLPEQGDRGDSVFQIKKQLQALGYYRPTATFSDEFNSTMVERLKMFQRNNGLTVTGKYDILTERTLMNGENLVMGEWYTGSAKMKKTNETTENAAHFEIEKTGSGTCTITRYSGESTTVRIPQSIRGLRVTEIGYHAFGECRYIEKVVVPEGVECIEEMAFYDCVSLEDIQLPESLTSIKDRAFMSCESLAEVKIPDGIIEIGANPFMACDALNTIVISEKHPRYRFADGMLIDKNEKRLISMITNESEVNIGGNIVEIGAFACASLKDVKKIVISDGVMRIGEWAFNACRKLQEVQLPPSVTQIGSGAFCNSTLLSTVNIPYGVETIEEDTFQGCENLRSEEVAPLKIPESVKEIKARAFLDCSKLSVMIIPKSVKEIGLAAFRNCDGLWKVRILGGSETKIGDKAFYGCDNLKHLVGY